MLSLNRQTSQLGTARRSILFFTRRLFRIYPLSVVTVLTLALIMHLTGGAKIDHLQIVSNLLPVSYTHLDVYKRQTQVLGAA